MLGRGPDFDLDKVVQEIANRPNSKHGKHHPKRTETSPSAEIGALMESLNNDLNEAAHPTTYPNVDDVTKQKVRLIALSHVINGPVGLKKRVKYPCIEGEVCS